MKLKLLATLAAAGMFAAGLAAQRRTRRPARWIGAYGATARFALFRSEFLVPVLHGPVEVGLKASGEARLLINGVLAEAGDITKIVAPGLNRVEVEVRTVEEAPALYLYIDGLRRAFGTDLSWAVSPDRDPSAGLQAVVLVERPRLALTPTLSRKRERETGNGERVTGDREKSNLQPCPLDFREVHSGGILEKALENRAKAQSRVVGLHDGDTRGHVVAGFPFRVASTHEAAGSLDPRRP